MNTSFVFDEGDRYGGGGAEAATQSPWEFSGYAKASEQEHHDRNTTSIDNKIKQRLNAGKQRHSFIQSDPSSDEEDEEDDEIEIKHELKRNRLKKEKQNETEEGSDEEDEKMEDASDDDDDDNEEENAKGENESGHDEEEENAKDFVNANGKLEGSRYAESKGSDEDDEDEDEKANNTAKHQQKKKSSKKTKDISNAKVQNPNKFFSSAENASFNASSFMELNISRPLIRACEALGYRQPTPIQAACIPLALSGRDICGSAVTGSGKTAAFALPILERLLFRPRRIPAIRVLIITPTRELAVQVHSMIEKLAQFTDVRCCLVVGGLSSKVQEVALRNDPDIVVATPGRMIDHLRNTQSVGLEDLAILVLDEADRLLQLGFREEIHELVKLCPSRRQTMLFSATMTNEVSDLIRLSLKSPVRLSADASTQRPSTLSEEVIRIRAGHEGDKEAIILSLCSRSFTSKTIIFSGTKMEAHRLKILFGLSGMKAAELHGNLTQAQRLESLDAFRKQEADFLVATDVAARGLDIIGVESVINLECPKDITTYVHRVGRTARAGRQGRAVTLVTEHDRALLKAVAKRAGSKLQKRIVPTTSVATWNQRIKDFEEDINQIIQQEREEKAMRKAEMEASKAQNMIDHEAEIFARPKKTWYRSEREKKHISKTSKEPTTEKEGVSVNEAHELKKREKRKAEQEKALPRRKRRRLEAEREAAEEEDGLEGNGENKGRNKRLVDVGYKRARAAKAVEKAKEEGRYKPKRGPENKKKKSRKEEMKESFQSDFGAAKRSKLMEKKKLKRKPGVTKRSFKSKSRYKRKR